ncbi:MAG: DoxX family protein [Bacteroidetes bacterium]|nr:DoxX family protein [Bacteroidota bacterium]MBS1628787.1 DoxX family protein [Bacteroidota bacterium]
MANHTLPAKKFSALNIFLQVLRVLMGLLFIFSGVVKANDPSGLANKMAEFFEPTVLNLPSLIPHALTFSVIMIACEIIFGVALLLGFAWRFFAWLMLGLNIFFTFLTAYIYYWDIIRHSAKVRECGCFGDCIKISNSETFWKDVVLLAIAILLFIYRSRIRPVMPKYPNTSVFILSVFFALGIQWWALEHLPFYDCMPYAVGKNICEGMQQPKGCIPDSVAMVFVYKHNGKLEDVGMDQLASLDSTWEFVDRKDKVVRKGNGLCDPSIKDFVVNDYNGNDQTQAMLQDPGYKFLIFLRDPAHARQDNLDKLRALSAEASAKGIPIYVLSSGSREANDAWQKMAALRSSEMYSFDQTASKTAMRTDPGLMLLHGCVIEGKWSFRDYPASLSAAGIKP